MSFHSGDRVFLATLTAVVASAGIAAGCGHVMQARDHVVPLAVPVMKQEQVLNPEAGKNRKVVAGLDGNAAKNVSDGYAKSFVPAQGQSTASFQGLEGLKSE